MAEGDNKNQNGGGAKALSIILMIVSLLAGMVAIVRPLENRINSLEHQIIKLEDAEHQMIEGVILNKAFEKRLDKIEDDFYCPRTDMHGD